MNNRNGSNQNYKAGFHKTEKIYMYLDKTMLTSRTFMIRVTMYTNNGQHEINSEYISGNA